MICTAMSLLLVGFVLDEFVVLLLLLLLLIWFCGWVCNGVVEWVALLTAVLMFGVVVVVIVVGGRAWLLWWWTDEWLALAFVAVDGIFCPFIDRSG